MDELHFEESTHTYTMGGKVLPSVTELCAPLTAAKYAVPSAVVDYAASRGTRVHELCALYDMDALPDDIEAECVGYVKAWAAFYRDWQPQWERIEWAGVSDSRTFTAPFAGTCDRIGVIDNVRRVVDIKTAKSFDRAAKVALCCQLRGYTEIAWSNGISITGGGLGVQLKDDGTYTLHWQEKIETRYGFYSAPLLDALCEIHAALKGDRNV